MLNTIKIASIGILSSFLWACTDLPGTIRQPNTLLENTIGDELCSFDIGAGRYLLVDRFVTDYKPRWMQAEISDALFRSPTPTTALYNHLPGRRIFVAEFEPMDAPCESPLIMEAITAHMAIVR